MKLRTYTEATAFVKQMLAAKLAGGRKLPGLADMDSVPAWTAPGPSPIVHKLDGSEVDLVYLSYMEADEKQKQEAQPARLAGVRLERITGRLVDVRECSDGTVQVLFTSGLRNADGKPAFRGPNIDKGILCALSIGEGLGESVDEIIARVPTEMIEKLKANKAKLAAKKKPKATTPLAKAIASIGAKPELKITNELGELQVKRGPAIIDVPSVLERKLKLK